ncbi:MAG: hypothetical protein OXG11_14870, partial [Chloroflexi bacterium]|nr:hypothetical protein [Chloroflexota bacterium]
PVCDLGHLTRLSIHTTRVLDEAGDGCVNTATVNERFRYPLDEPDSRLRQLPKHTHEHRAVRAF